MPITTNLNANKNSVSAYFNEYKLLFQKEVRTHIENHKNQG